MMLLLGSGDDDNDDNDCQMASRKGNKRVKKTNSCEFII